MGSKKWLRPRRNRLTCSAKAWNKFFFKKRKKNSENLHSGLSFEMHLAKRKRKIKTFLPSRGRSRFKRGYLSSVAPSFSNQEPTNSGQSFSPHYREAWRGRGWSVFQVCLLLPVQKQKPSRSFGAGLDGGRRSGRGSSRFIISVMKWLVRSSCWEYVLLWML